MTSAAVIAWIMVVFPSGSSPDFYNEVFFPTKAVCEDMLSRLRTPYKKECVSVVVPPIAIKK